MLLRFLAFTHDGISYASFNKSEFWSMTMNTNTQPNANSITKSDFIDLLSGEFTGKKGFGVYAFLSFKDIENLYANFLGDSMPASVFIKVYVRNF